MVLRRCAQRVRAGIVSGQHARVIERVYTAPAAGLRGYVGNPGNPVDTAQIAWYYAGVRSAYELGLINGRDGVFDPQGKLSLAESIPQLKGKNNGFFPRTEESGVSDNILGGRVANVIAVPHHIPILIACSSGMTNFKKIRSYPGFSDVQEDAWYYAGVRSAYELSGVTSGIQAIRLIRPKSSPLMQLANICATSAREAGALKFPYSSGEMIPFSSA